MPTDFYTPPAFTHHSGLPVRTNTRLPNLLPRLLLAVALLLTLSSTGCVRRRLTVRTQPPGAQVFVDDQEIGTTPCSSSFVYYGTRKITLIKDGYRTETLYQKIHPFRWAWICYAAAGMVLLLSKLGTAGYAVAWVLANPDPLPLGDTNYRR